MATDFLSQILQGATSFGARTGGAAGAPAGLGGVLGGLFGRGQESSEVASSPGGQAGQSGVVAMLLPLAIRWMQDNGGIGAVLQRFQQHGLGQQAASWVSTGENQPVDAQEVKEVVGSEELSKLSEQLGVPHEAVASGLAQIIPRLVNHLTPDGEVPQNADSALGASLAAVEQFLGRARTPGGQS